MSTQLTQSVLFITGAFIGNNCWDEWMVYFETKGYVCIAPAWPYKDAPSEELRNRHPDGEVASNRIADLTEFFAEIVKKLPDKPIIIGHSLGGLITQVLLHRGLGCAGVAIHSFPPPGVNTFNYSFLKSIWETMGFFTSTQKTYLVRFAKWRKTFANGMDFVLQKELYYMYAVPESKKIVRDMINGLTKIDFVNPHAPLLITSGSDDQIIPASLNFNNYRKYKVNNSIIDYKNFKGRNHLVFGHPSWTEDADYILSWLEKIK